MATFRNVSDDVRFIPEGAPQTVAPDALFEVPDDRVEAFESQPWFKPAARPATKKG